MPNSVESVMAVFIMSTGKAFSINVSINVGLPAPFAVGLKCLELPHFSPINSWWTFPLGGVFVPPFPRGVGGKPVDKVS